MNIFVLCTGRCGSATFAEACRHITNFTVGHETRTGILGQRRLAYPANHIEVDNRLAWMLGRLDARFGDDALYVHLHRERSATARSYSRRFGKGLAHAYATGILSRLDKMTPDAEPQAICEDLWDTVNANIRLFLRDKSRVLDFPLEHAVERFPTFWELAGAEGDLHRALDTWTVRWNQSGGSGERVRYPRDLRSVRRQNYVSRPARERLRGWLRSTLRSR